jgi:hypothetical protein
MFRNVISTQLLIVCYFSEALRQGLQIDAKEVQCGDPVI